jgi:hypothetical protein
MVIMGCRALRDCEQKSLLLSRAVVEKLDSEGAELALKKARDLCERWIEQNPCSDLFEWREVLKQPWAEVRKVLLDETEKGCQLRQSLPFCGVLSRQERWRMLKFHRNHDSFTA